MTPGPRELREHVLRLLTRHGISMSERHEPFNPLLVYSAAESRSIQVQPVMDATTYAIALHEIGHVVAQRKKIGIFSGNHDDPMFVYDLIAEEYAAWEWAQSVALYWPVEMAHLRELAMGSYLQMLAEAREKQGV